MTMTMTTLTRRAIRNSAVYRKLTVYRYVAVDLPRTTTAVLIAALLTLAGAHVYMVRNEPQVPGYLLGYTVLLVVACVATSAALAFGSSALARAGRAVGAVLCLGFVVAYAVSRATGLPELPQVRGWWDWAPGTLAGAGALLYLAVELAVVAGVAVARPERQAWHD